MAENTENLNINIPIDEVIDAGEAFLNATKGNQHARYKSWEHCYAIFQEKHDKKKSLDDNDYDALALHLAFYLASWGMYRGSSFLLQQDYKVHIEAVKELMQDAYKGLWQMTSESYKLEENQDSLRTLVANLTTIYQSIRKQGVTFKLTNEAKALKAPKTTTNEAEDAPQVKDVTISPILISKILLGTLGCMPAYDRFFTNTLVSASKSKKNAFSNTDQILENLPDLAEYYDKHKGRFEELQTEFSITYPPMKILDMCFWQLSYEKGIQEKEAKKIIL